MIQELHAASRKEKWDKRNWHAVDLDGTLAKEIPGWEKHKDLTRIGPPIPAMVKRIKEWLRKGEQVRIFTARVDDLIRSRGPGPFPHTLKDSEWFWDWKEDEDTREAIRNYTQKLFGQGLESTNHKDKWMVDLWDDRARGVVPNTGKTLEASSAVRLLTRRSRL